jgi:hypothetical protein
MREIRRHALSAAMLYCKNLLLVAERVAAEGRRPA